MKHSMFQCLVLLTLVHMDMSYMGFPFLFLLAWAAVMEDVEANFCNMPDPPSLSIQAVR